VGTLAAAQSPGNISDFFLISISLTELGLHEVFIRFSHLRNQLPVASRR
jgi:hypothetical protein